MRGMQNLRVLPLLVSRQKEGNAVSGPGMLGRSGFIFRIRISVSSVSSGGNCVASPLDDMVC